MSVSASIAERMSGISSNPADELALAKIEKKKGKDKRWIKNWRPIWLINVDTKIISKVLANRLEKVLRHLIHPNQNVFVKGSVDTVFSGVA